MLETEAIFKHQLSWARDNEVKYLAWRFESLDSKVFKMFLGGIIHKEKTHNLMIIGILMDIRVIAL